MTIKEVEKRIGMTSANIRYYEKEGLLVPKRGAENNYRNYSEEDVELLRKVKILRMLGVSVADIRQLVKDDEELVAVIEKRREELKKEEQHLKEIDKICRFIAEERMSFETMNCEVLEEEVKTFADRIDYIIRGDITKEVVSEKKLNNMIGGMTLYAFLLNAVLTFVFGTAIYGGTGGVLQMLWPVVLVSLFCAIGVSWTAKPIAQTVLFQITSLALWLLILMIHYGVMLLVQPMLGEALLTTEVVDGIDVLTKPSVLLLRDSGTLLFLFAAGAVAVLWMLSWKKGVLKNKKAVLLAGVLYTLAMTVVYHMATGIHLAIGFVGILLIVLYLSLTWVDANLGAGEINKYYAITSASMMVNVPARLMRYGSIGMEKGYGRQDMWKE